MAVIFVLIPRRRLVSDVTTSSSKYDDGIEIKRKSASVFLIGIWNKINLENPDSIFLGFHLSNAVKCTSLG